jgi:hypothetical protein
MDWSERPRELGLCPLSGAHRRIVCVSSRLDLLGAVDTESDGFLGFLPIEAVHHVHLYALHRCTAPDG